MVVEYKKKKLLFYFCLPKSFFRKSPYLKPNFFLGKWPGKS
jgi:hypothetical protein